MRLATAESLDIGGFLNAFGGERRVSPYKKKQTIFSQGDRSDSMFYIVNGSVKLALVSRSGKEAVIAIAGPGKLFGESCISLDHSVRFHSAVALTDAHLIKISKTTILRTLRAGGDASVNFVAAVLLQNAQVQEDLGTKLGDSAEESLGRVISSLVQSKTDTSLPRISQQTIAEMVGISRQRVNVLMKRSGFAASSHAWADNVSASRKSSAKKSSALLTRDMGGKEKR